jgi:hypothetical protein
LRRLVSPTTSANTFTARLRLLTGRKYLTRHEVIAGLRRIYLYGAGPRSREAGGPPSWTPALNQLAHTLAVEATLVRLVDPTVTPTLTTVDWQGEADIREWTAPGHPYPDLLIGWAGSDRDGVSLRGHWAVEVDRATEGRGAWRRKFGRYLLASTHNRQILVVTTSDARARNLAKLALSVGYPTLTTSLAEVLTHDDPPVWDTNCQQRSRLSEASLAFAEKRITYIKLGGHVRIEDNALQTFIESGRRLAASTGQLTSTSPDASVPRQTSCHHPGCGRSHERT